MLFNPRWKFWSKPTMTDAKPATWGHMIAWLENQPSDKYYQYSDPRGCLAAQYNKSIGRPYVIPHEASKRGSFDQKLEYVAASNRSRTFGGALKIAKKMLEYA